MKNDSEILIEKIETNILLERLCFVIVHGLYEAGVVESECLHWIRQGFGGI